MNINDKLYKRIRELQAQRNWSTNHLAVEAEISAATITNWFNRNATPSIKAINNICIAFGITLSEFFNESEGPVELTKQQRELLAEWDLLHKKQKQSLLDLIKSTNDIIKQSKNTL